MEPQEGAEGEEVEVPVTAFCPNTYDEVKTAWAKALAPEGTPPFAGDLENPLYLKIVQSLRNFNPENYPSPE